MTGTGKDLISKFNLLLFSPRHEKNKFNYAIESTFIFIEQKRSAESCQLEN